MKPYRHTVTFEYDSDSDWRDSSWLVLPKPATILSHEVVRNLPELKAGQSWRDFNNNVAVILEVFKENTIYYRTNRQGYCWTLGELSTVAFRKSYPLEPLDD